jgi:high-affinity Fe2+/Pb2+ permease
VAKNILKFTVTGIVVGVALGWLLSLVSGNLFVVLMVGTLGLIVGGILGMVHRNDP